MQAEIRRQEEEAKKLRLQVGGVYTTTVYKKRSLSEG